jgi:hypothetical protein
MRGGPLCAAHPVERPQRSILELVLVVEIL